MSISRGPHGHGGKLHFLYEQVKSHGLNVVGIQEGRHPDGVSMSHHIYRTCSGACNGQYGVEMWSTN